VLPDWYGSISDLGLKHERRQKLSNQIHEQIKMVKAVQSRTEFLPVKIHSIKGEVPGETRKVEISKRLKPWRWPRDSGKMCITVRYGASTLEVVEGKKPLR